MSNTLVVGVDIGGSHITAALVDLAARTVLPETLVREHVDSQGSAPAIITAWAGAIQAAQQQAPVPATYIGVAMPGPFDYTNGVSRMQGQSKYDALYDQDVRGLLSEALQQNAQDIRFLNDAACFLQGEVFGGAVQGYHDIIGLTLGTGLGAAKYHGKEAADAALWCSPFLDGIAEDYLATRWFVHRYAQRTGHTLAGVRELAALAETTPAAQALFEEYGHNLGTFLANFIAQDQPQAVVIGGNIAKAFHLFMPQAQQVLRERKIAVPLFRSFLAEEAALVGAASCWSDSVCQTTLID